MHLFAIIFCVVFGAWVCVSSMLWIYRAFKPGNGLSQSAESRGTFGAAGAFFGFGFFFSGIFYAALFFIPRSWGAVSDDGESVGIRFTVAVMLGAVASVFTLARLEKRIDEKQAQRSNSQSTLSKQVESGANGTNV